MTRALVTGANGGIGQAIVERLHRDGYDVVTLDKLGPADILIDLASEVPTHELFQSIDVCVSNAGIVDTLSPSHRMSPAKWERDISVNLTGAFRVMQACLPGMQEREFGRIIAISSIAASLGSAGQAAYAASKAGLIAAVKTIAIENTAAGITANSILPGMIGTDRVLSMPPDVLARVKQEIAPASRLGHPHEVAALVAFLASPDAAYITGESIVIDGGMSLNAVALGRA